MNLSMLRIRQFYGIISGLQTDGPLGGLFNDLNRARNCDIRKLLKMPLLSLNLVIMMKFIVIFLNKKPPEFWKAWYRKFSKSVCKNTSINGLNDNRSIVNAFRSQFGAVYYNSDVDTASVSAFETMLKNYKSSNSCDDKIND